MRWRRADRHGPGADRGTRRAADRPPRRRRRVRPPVRDRRSWPEANRDPALLSCFLLLAALGAFGVISGTGATALHTAVVCGEQASNLLRRAPVGVGRGLLHATRYELGHRYPAGQAGRGGAVYLRISGL